MVASVSPRTLLPAPDVRGLLIKWVVAFIVPVAIFTFVWNGAQTVNTTLPSLFAGDTSSFSTAIPALLFIAVLYLTLVALTGYLVAVDSGRRNTIELWIDMVVFAVLPIIIISPVVTNNLIIGLGVCAVLWMVYLLVRNRIRKAVGYNPVEAIRNMSALDTVQETALVQRATLGSFWFGTTLAIVWLVADIIFYATSTLSTLLLIWAIIRTILLPVASYFLGRLAGRITVRSMQPLTGVTAKASGNGTNGTNGTNGPNGNGRVNKRRELQLLSAERAREEAKDVVPNDLPLQTRGAQRFYLILLGAFVLFYPVIDPFLFGFGTDARLSNYGDAGFYIILALGLNIVVGFAGLLDLGYVAFFAIGAYTWGIIGSTQLQFISGIIVRPDVWPWLFWPMLLVAALVAAGWGVLLGAPTLRLRGDYLAIVTLGFGEIVPAVFLNLNKYTNGNNGIIGIFSPAFPGVKWNSITPTPYYYLILALIALTIFANVRLRDSRLGRAWIAMREDEIAASSSGINLVNTKLFAFGAGAFFSGLAGMYHAAKLGTVSPDNFSFGDSVIYLAMVVIGGLGSIPGVIVGAIVVYSINLLILAQLDTYASDPTNFLHVFGQILPGFTFGNIRNLIFGVILVSLMIFRPEGLIPSARRRRELKSQVDPLEITPLDPAPGDPGFEPEVRVQ